MTSYRGMWTDSPWSLPVPAVSVSVGTRPGASVTPAGSSGDLMRAQRGGAPVVPVVPGAGLYLPRPVSGGRVPPTASNKAGPPPTTRPSPPTGAQMGATATPPASAPPAPIHSDPTAPDPQTTSPPARGHHRRERK